MAANSMTLATYSRFGAESSFTLRRGPLSLAARLSLVIPNASMRVPPTSGTGSLARASAAAGPREPRDVHRASGPWSTHGDQVRSATAWAMSRAFWALQHFFVNLGGFR